MDHLVNHFAMIARGLDKNGIDPDHINTSSTNQTYIGMAKKYCHLNECPQSWWEIKYRPSVAGNAIYAVMLIALLLAQLFFGVRKKTWAYMSTVCLGIFGEIIGYIGRIMLNGNPFSENDFLINLIPLTIAPALLTAGIYVCLGRVITAVGSENSRLKPKMYTIVFVGFDLFSLIIQSAGGAIAATAKDSKGSKFGTHIMIVGLCTQVVSMIIFFAIWLDFTLRTRRARLSGSLARTQPPLYHSLRSSKAFTFFQASLFIASLLIFVRCLFRVAELWDGFSGHLANDQAAFMVFEGPMIIGAVLAMTIFHPGRVFGDLWVPAGKGVRGAVAGDKFDTSSSTELNDNSWNPNAKYSQV